MTLEKHKALTAVRARAYGELFGCKPSAAFPPHALFKKPDERFPIDILVYTLEAGSGEIDVAVTNITLTIGEKQLVASSGMFANMPVGTPHSFKNEGSKPARMLISVAPAGLEQMFFEVGVPLPEGSTTARPPTREEIENLLAVAPRYGIQIKLPQP